MAESSEVNAMFDHLADLEKSRTDWKIKAWVTRLWPTNNAESGVVKGFNLILLDNDNYHLHAYVYPDTWKAIGKDVKEGGVYIFEGFQVRDTYGRLRPVSTNIDLRFLNSTKIQAVEEDIMIPKHKFEIMEVGDFSNKVVSLRLMRMLNVMGMIEEWEPASRVPTRYGERETLRFKLSDGRVVLGVCLWGELAVTVSNEYESEKKKPVVAIIASSKLTTFRQELQIGALPSTRIYLNLNIEAVEVFRKRLEEEGYKSPAAPIRPTITPPPASPLLMFSLKHLTENLTSFSEKNTVMVTFKISDIEDKENWWYYACQSCHEELEKVDRKYKCTVCPRSFSYGEKRFQLLVLADDNSFASTVVLTDRVVKRLAKTTVTNLMNSSKEAPNSEMPPVLRNIVGKTVTVKISLSKSNVAGDSNIYKVVDLCEGSVSGKKVAEYSPITKFPSFEQSQTDDYVVCLETPTSSDSVSKKIKMEP
ncbi:replication protein A 70 kDa DNA-binding subunit C [Daucus carota subsp. sativus]|uniref:replication protein A 70 kDa DNA-binding subunit C n=1 Tax=Daucus carota subsp. sativus TaxID=79200 RepID=UPI0007F03D9D|nr:PREDICTED: replication protein A 70 kDa DNA-binding subunit C-like [Daucus carota subsp. sativus]